MRSDTHLKKIVFNAVGWFLSITSHLLCNSLQLGMGHTVDTAAQPDAHRMALKHRMGFL
jgi:hypothetical protein